MLRSIRHLCVPLGLAVVLLTSPSGVGEDAFAPSIEAMLERRDVAFGFADDNHLCAEFARGATSSASPRDLFHTVYERAWHYLRLLPYDSPSDVFAAIPNDSLPSPLGDEIGDTVAVICSSRTGHATVEEIGIHQDVCDFQIAYRLQPLDTMSIRPQFDDALLVLKRNVRVPSQIVPYTRYDVQDVALRRFECEMLSMLTDTNDALHEPPLEGVWTEYYGRREPSRPDTLYATIHGLPGLTTEWCWHAVYLIVRAGTSWTWTAL